MDTSRDNLLTKAYSLHPLHVATIEHYAREQGYPSASSALRRIVDEWKQLKAETQPTPEQVAQALVAGDGLDRQFLAHLQMALGRLGYHLCPDNGRPAAN